MLAFIRFVKFSCIFLRRFVFVSQKAFSVFGAMFLHLNASSSFMEVVLRVIFNVC